MCTSYRKDLTHIERTLANIDNFISCEYKKFTTKTHIDCSPQVVQRSSIDLTKLQQQLPDSQDAHKIASQIYLDNLGQGSMVVIPIPDLSITNSSKRMPK